MTHKISRNFIFVLSISNFFLSFYQVVKHRPLDGMEHRMQRYRERQLEVPGEEEEEVEEELEEEEEQIKVIGETEKTVEGASGGTQAADGGDSPAQVARDRKSRSRTRSRSGSSSGSVSGSGSRASSRSKSGSRSGSGSRSRSNSPAGSKKSGSRSRSGSRI